ncbi:MAG TPA: hypothetical protein DCM86_02310 [Verrucomicrobiales bacterium]|nr:hypothetical protein [Verrucomicrobiales bacterium]
MKSFIIPALICLWAVANQAVAAVAGDPVTPPAASAPAAVFSVTRFQVEGNTVLKQSEVEWILAPYRGPKVTFDTLRQALARLQLEYRNRGFVTVAVSLPRQELKEGVVRVQVTEGRLVDIAITGNEHYSAENIRRALPSLSTNGLLNTSWFQAELDRANANPDRQIYPVITPGPEPGTSVLGLKVKDRLPLHGHMEINNKATPGTPALRTDLTAQYNNLWQRDHQAGLQYNFSPQVMKTDAYAARFFDQPEVASYSGFYRIPFQVGQTPRETFDSRPGDFGYDPVTRAFRLPGGAGSGDWILYASRSGSESPTRLGPLTIITNNPIEDISSQFAQRELTWNVNLGTKASLPLPEFLGVRSLASLGIDFKRFTQSSWSTNITYADLYHLDADSNRILTTNTVDRLDAFSSTALHYFPISLGWSGSHPDRQGVTYFALGETLFLRGLASGRGAFRTVAGSAEAGRNTLLTTLTLTREQRLGGEWSILARAGGQISTAPLISNEQFGLGGTGGVRGYQEGQDYGDAGWRVGTDLRAPPIPLGYLPRSNNDIPIHLRGSWFVDYGQLHRMSRPAPTPNFVEQLGTGLGAYITAGGHFEARLTLAWALLSTPLTQAGTGRAYFTVGYQF